MYFSLVLVALLGISCNVNAQINPSKYTVALNFDGLGYNCAAAIIKENFVISSGECFASQMMGYVDVSSITAIAEGVNGKVEIKVDAVNLPYFYAGRGRSIHDFAVVKLKENLNLQDNGLVALQLPTQKFDVNEYKDMVGSISTPGSEDTQKVEIVDSKDCANSAYRILMPSSQFCTKLQNTYNKKCSGKKGSPVVDGDVLIGVQLDCQEDLPYELFAKVSYFRNIIDNVLDGKPGPYNTHNYS